METRRTGRAGGGGRNRSSRSFRGAARELELWPTALSHAIGSLEDRLGVRLFNRTTGSVSVTGHAIRAEVAGRQLHKTPADKYAGRRWILASSRGVR